MIDITVYIDDVKNISKSKYKEYIKNFKMISEMHPEIDFETHTGFLPFKIEVDKEFLKDVEILTGFEYYVDSYNFEQEKNSINEQKLVSKHPKGLKHFLGSLFGRRKIIKETVKEVFVNEKVDKVLSNCKNSILISFGSVDSFELRMAFSFACFLVETCNGVMYDPDSENWYLENIYEILFDDINDYEKDYNISNITIHEFEEWL